MRARPLGWVVCDGTGVATRIKHCTMVRTGTGIYDITCDFTVPASTGLFGVGIPDLWIETAFYGAYNDANGSGYMEVNRLSASGIRVTTYRGDTDAPDDALFFIGFNLFPGPPG